MAWIRKVPPSRAQGKVAREYRAGERRTGKVYEILQVQSLMPDVLQASMQLYKATMLQSTSLPRFEREFLGVVVSSTNECYY